MKVEGPSHIETQATDPKGSVGRHFGLVAAHGKTKYDKRKKDVQDKLAASAPWMTSAAAPTPPAPVAKAPSTTSPVAPPVVKPGGLTQEQQAIRSMTPDQRKASYQAGRQDVLARTQQARQATQPYWDAKKLTQQGGVNLAGGQPGTITPDTYTSHYNQAPKQVTSTAPVMSRPANEGGTIGGLTDVATSFAGPKVNLYGGVAGTLGGLGVGFGRQLTADTNKEDQDPFASARARENTNAASTAAVSAGKAISLGRNTGMALPGVLGGLEAGVGGATGDVSDAVQGAANWAPALATKAIGGGPAALASHASGVLTDGIRKGFTDKGIQATEDTWRNQVLADQGRTGGEKGLARLKNLATGALGDTASSGAALGRMWGGEAVDAAEKGFVADASARKHYLDRKEQYAKMYEKAYGDPDKAALLAEHAATQDANNMYRASMLGKDSVFAGKDNSGRFGNTEEGKRLGQLANQIGHANLKRLLEDPDQGPAVYQMITGGQQVDPAEYGLNTGTYAHRK